MWSALSHDANMQKASQVFMDALMFVQLESKALQAQ